MKFIKFMHPWYALRCLLFVSAILITSTSSALTPMQCTQMCDWFSSTFPLCANQDHSWGYENNQSCIGRQVCEAPWNTGGIVEHCDVTEDASLCASMIDRKYFSNRLYSLGLPNDHLYYNHLQVAFDVGTLSATYSDVVFGGNYRCENGQVLVSMMDEPEYAIDLSEDLSQLSFAPMPGGDLIDYTLKTLNGVGCGLLANNRYEVDPAHLAAVTLPAGTSYSVEFGPAPYAHLSAPQANYDNMLYDCAFGELHLHRSVGDGTPITGTIEDEGASVLLELDENTSWRFLREDDPVMCPNLYEPVCSVELQDIVCVTEPCPIGVYKTYPNRCVSDNAPAMFIQEGKCGDLEGEPYYDQEVCTTEYDPVCAAMINPEVCLIAPCPVQQYRTYSNSCVARSAGAKEIRDGECGDVEGDRIFDLSAEGLACAGVWEPVCAKDESGIVCVTEPCPTHEYATFGNSCEASIAVADIAWPHQACGDLEGRTSNTAPPVEMVETAIASVVTVEDAAIRDDTLYVTLRHTGCEPQYFDFQVERAFSENAEVRWAFKAVSVEEQTCLAYQEADLRFDLAPLKALYEERFGDGPATIVLPGLVDYDINQDVVQKPSLVLNVPESGKVGSSVTIRVTGQFFGEEAPDYPSISVASPTGQSVVTRYDHNQFGGPPWKYNMIESFTPEVAGDYSVTVTWVAVDLQETATIAVEADETGECAEAGVDLSSVNEYPNFPNLDWKGDPYNANYGDYMSYEGDVYRARWWTTSIPGSDLSWEFVCTL